MPAHRLIDIHRAERWRVESREPHVAHDHDLERIFRIFETGGELPTLVFVADVLLPVRSVFGATSHYDFHHTRFAGIVVVTSARPFWSQLDDRVVYFDADATAHADDHCLAF